MNAVSPSAWPWKREFLWALYGCTSHPHCHKSTDVVDTPVGTIMNFRLSTHSPYSGWKLRIPPSRLSQQKGPDSRHSWSCYDNVANKKYAELVPIIWYCHGPGFLVSHISFPQYYWCRMLHTTTASTCLLLCPIVRAWGSVACDTIYWQYWL